MLKRSCCVLFALVACTPKVDNYQVLDRSGTLTLNVAVKDKAKPVFDARVKRILVEVRAADDATSLQTREVPLSLPVSVPLSGLPSGRELVVEARGVDATEVTMFRTLVSVTPLAIGAKVATDVILNGVPALQVVSTEGQAGDISVRFHLQDPEDDPCTVAVEYRGGKNIAFYGGATTVEATTDPLTPGLNLERHWRSNGAGDEAGVQATVQLRLIPSDANPGIGSETATFVVDNRDLVIAAPHWLTTTSAFTSTTLQLCFSDEGAASYEVRLLAKDGAELQRVTTSDTCVDFDDLAQGAYRAEVVARNLLGTPGDTATLSFRVDATAPAVPLLDPVSSPRGAEVVTFAWTAIDDGVCGDVPCEVSYRFELGTDATFAAAPLVDTLSKRNDFAWTPPSTGGHFYFRVRSIDEAQIESAPSVVGDVIVDALAPSPPVLQPSTPPITSDDTPTVHWLPVGSETVRFHVQLATDASFTSPVIDDLTPITDPALPQTSYTVAAGSALVQNGIYWVRVFARDAADNESVSSTLQSFVLDTTGPTQPAGCAVVPSTCFQEPCAYVASSGLQLMWDPPVVGDEVHHYRLDVLEDVVGVLQPRASIDVPPSVPQTIGGQPRLTGDLPSGTFANDGRFVVRLFAVDQAGSVSAHFNCTTTAGGGSEAGIAVDLSPPDPPRLLGAYVAYSDQDSDSVVPTLYFEPASINTVGAPVVGYYFEYRDLGDSSNKRCRMAVDSNNPTTGPAVDCTFSPLDLGEIDCDSGTGTCVVVQSADLPAQDDRIYEISLRAVDAAGNRSAEALRGPVFGPLPVHQVYADVSPPTLPGFSGLQLSPVTCGSGQGDRLDPTDNADGGLTFSWSPAQQPPTHYLLMIEEHAGSSSDCNSTANWGCDASLRCTSGDECEVCTSSGVYDPEGPRPGKPISLSCDPTLGTVCLCPHPLGDAACDSTFIVQQGWNGAARYNALLGNVTSANVRVPRTQGPESRWQVLPVDAAGNTTDRTFVEPTTGRNCGAFDQYLATFRLERAFANSFNGMLYSPIVGAPPVVGRPRFVYQLGSPFGSPDANLVHLQVQRKAGAEFTDTVIDEVIDCSGGSCQCYDDPTTPSVMCDGDSNNPAHFTSYSYFDAPVGLPDGDYRWRINDAWSGAAQGFWYPCDDTYAYFVDGQKRCDLWGDQAITHMSIGTDNGYFTVVGGSFVPNIVWPPAGYSCSPPLEVAWNGPDTLNNDAFEFEIRSLATNGVVTNGPAETNINGIFKADGGAISTGWYFARVRLSASGTWSPTVTFEVSGSPNSCMVPP